MAHATLEQTARINAETDFRSSIIDPLPTYPEYAGKLGVDLYSGGLRLDFTYGYAAPADIHAAIARLRDALDRLDTEVDAAIERQAMAALPASGVIRCVRCDHDFQACVCDPATGWPTQVADGEVVLA